MSTREASPADSWAGDEEDARPRKRMRRGACCHTCRRKKLKCDGKKPVCSTCAASKSAPPCEYDDASTPAKKKTTSATRAAYGSRGEAPIDRLPSPISSRSAGRPHSFNADGAVSQVGSHHAASSHSAGASTSHKSGGGHYGRHAETRIAELESQVASLTNLAVSLSNPSLSREVHGDPSDARLKRALVSHGGERGTDKAQVKSGTSHLKGKSFRTSYWGPSYPLSMTAEIAELDKYYKEVFHRHPELIRAIGDLKGLSDDQKRRQRENALRKAVVPLAELMPDEATTSAYVQLYKSTFDQTFHLLHSPSFDEEYNELWTKPLSEADSGFLATVLLICAATVCLVERDNASFYGESTASSQKAQEWVAACTTWIDSQSRKHLTLRYFQNYCILILTKFLLAIKVKRRWADTGLLFRIAVSAGLHLETADDLSQCKVNVFDQEARRRIWAVIAELELLACLWRGMSSQVEDFHDPGHFVHNVDDQHLSPELKTLPQAVSNDKWSPVACLSTLDHSREIRANVIRRLNRRSVVLSKTEVLDIEDELLACLEALPDWENAPEAEQVGLLSAMPRVMVSSPLKQLLLLLYHQAIRSTNDQSTRACWISRCFDVAASILSDHRKLSRPASIIVSSMTSDILQAALSICYGLYASSSLTNAAIPNSTFDFNMVLDLAEDSLKHLEIRQFTVGGVYRRLWFLANALILSASKHMSATRAKEFETRIVQEILNMVYKILSRQETRPWGPSRDKFELQQLTNSNSGPAPEIGGFQPQMQWPSNGLNDLTMPPLDEFDLAMLADWNMGNFFDTAMHN